MKTKPIILGLSFCIAMGLISRAAAQVNIPIGDLPAGKAVIISHSVTINSGTLLTSTSSQGVISGSNFAGVLTDDPDVGGISDPTITPIQQPPTLANIAKGVTEDIVALFSAAEFDIAFSDLNPGDILEVLRITSLPTKGILKLGASQILTTPTDIPRASIGSLSYQPDLDETGADSFGWNASDGVVFADPPALVNLSIAAVNDPPNAAADVIQRHPTQSVKIPVAALLVNDDDVEGNVPLVLTGVNYTGGNGATLTLNGGIVFYLPNGYTGADTFEYFVEDSLGTGSVGIVTLTLISDDALSSNVVLAESLPGGGMQVTFAGIPGRMYRVQSTDILTPPNWTDRVTVPADAQGRIIFIDPPGLPDTRMYRTVSP